MNPSKLADIILKKIETEAITPKSKLYFYLRNFLVWGLFTLATLLGAISFAVILYALFNTDFAIGEFVESKNLVAHWISFLPLLWVLIIGLAVGLGISGLKHTKRGYRIALVTLVGSNVLGSAVLGTGLYAAGGAEIIEQAIEEKVPFYKSAREKQLDFWGNPRDKGRLAGKVISVNESNSTMTIEGIRGEEWTVPYGVNYPLKTAPAVGSFFKAKGRLEDGNFKPERMRPAPNQNKMHDQVKNYLERNPEFRSKFESKLSPTTKSALEATRANGDRPSSELQQKIRSEIRANTPEAERPARGERPKLPADRQNP